MKVLVCGALFFFSLIQAIELRSVRADEPGTNLPTIYDPALLGPLLGPVLKATAKDPRLGQYGFQFIEMAADRILTDEVQKQFSLEQLTRIPFRDALVQDLVDALASGEVPLLLGDKGVGKEAVVERLAQLIVQAEIPDRPIFRRLRKADVLTVSPAQVSKLELSNGQKGILAFLNLVQTAQVNLGRHIVVYVDQAHLLGRDGLAELAAFAVHPQRKVSLIVGAQPDELKRWTLENPKLLSGFTPVAVDDLATEQVVEIFAERFARTLEEKFGVTLKGRALELAARYGKKVYPTLSTMDATERLLSDAAVLLNHRSGGVSGALALDDAAVMEFLKKKIGMDADPADAEAFARYEQELKDYLNSRVQGQPGMVNAIVETWLDLQDPANRRGIRVITLLGPTGVGKTFAATQFARKVFQSEKALLEIAASEYSTPGSIDALLGAPLNYKGSDRTAGILNDWLDDATRGKNGGVLVFNEIEKASPELMTVLMEILDNGRILGKDGVERKLGRHLVIFTSNRGTNVLFPKGYERWSEAELERHLESITQDRMKELFQRKTSGTDEFKATPEFLARIDRFETARPISRNVAFGILRATANGFVRETFEQFGIKLKIQDSVLSYLLKTKFNPAEGIRVTERSLDLQLKRALASARVQLKLTPGTKLTLSVAETRDGKFLLNSLAGNKRLSTELQSVNTDPMEDSEFVERLRVLDTKMKSMVMGQDLVIDTVKKAVVGFYARGKSARPLGLFLVGTTGGGKTEMGRALAYGLYDDASRVEVINFGNVKNEAGLNNKFGSQAGYKGMEEIREFEQALMRNPSGGVLVFDEISNMGGANKEEKEALFKQFYEIFEEARWYSAQTNTTYDLSKYVIICTGNDGEKLFQGVAADDLRLAIWQRENNPESVTSHLREAGVPEAFLGRLAGIFLMKPLLTVESQRITEKLMRGPLEALKNKYGIEVQYGQEFLSQFTQTYFSQTKGARSLRNVIEDRLEGILGIVAVENGGFKNLRGRKFRLHLSDNLTKRPFVRSLRAPARKVLLTVELLDKKGEVVATHVDDMTYDAPVVLKALLEQAYETAFHEAGHAVVNNPDLTSQKVRFITINGQGKYLGYARYDAVNTGVFQGSMTEGAMVAWVAQLYAGQRAQVLAGFPQDTGWGSDREKANKIITRFLVESGMHPELTGMERVDEKYVPSETQRKIIGKEIQRYTELAIAQADEVLTANWHLVRSVVARIIRAGAIGEQEFDAILREKRFADQKWVARSKAGKLELESRPAAVSLCESLF